MHRSIFCPNVRNKIICPVDQPTFKDIFNLGIIAVKRKKVTKCHLLRCPKGTVLFQMCFLRSKNPEESTTYFLFKFLSKQTTLKRSVFHFIPVVNISFLNFWQLFHNYGNGKLSAAGHILFPGMPCFESCLKIMLKPGLGQLYETEEKH